MRRLAMVAILICPLVVLAPGCRNLGLFPRFDRSTRSAAPRIGHLAPDIEGEDLDGTRFKLSDYRGKVVVVTFWASWCKYCLDRIPHERFLVERHQGKPFAFLGVNNDDEREPALKVVATRGINWRNWHLSGTKNPVNDRWQIKMWPTTYVIDKNGIIRYVDVSGVHLENAIESLLAETR